MERKPVRNRKRQTEYRYRTKIKSNEGFTLIECLISLVVLMSILLFLQPFLKTVTTIEEQAKKADYLEVQTGKIQIEMETRNLKYQKIENNRLIYESPDEGLVIFEQYKQMIRKTTNKLGHQPIMLGVENVTFTEQNRLIEMEVTTCEKETYTYFLFY